MQSDDNNTDDILADADLAFAANAVTNMPVELPGDLAKRTHARVVSENPLAYNDLAHAASAVETMSVDVPEDLAKRTHARLVAVTPFKRVFFMLRPITHPVARVAAAALIILGLAPLTDLDIADVLGRRIEERIIGRAMTDKIEGMVDGILVINGAPGYNQHDLDAMMGVNTPHVRRPRSNGGSV